MKVGTDGTLIGAWATIPCGCRRILDIGTGSGLIAIMAAQRSNEAQVIGIDIDNDCIEQARENIAASPWDDRITITHSSLQEFSSSEGFDVIISNPPYFVDSLLSPDEKRTTARHTTTLTFKELSDNVVRLLSPEGTFSLILPPTEADLFMSAARGALFLRRRCDVWSTPDSGVKRVMMELQTQPPTELPTIEKLIIEDGGPMAYSDEYKQLTRDFYLKF
ncbi:MAG: methyltransferase [Alistipes sp.]|nr:methyltransferase [Alistipes sp.]